jgi:tRNA threonylcarbamoyl adenosine modification protein YeaZ
MLHAWSQSQIQSGKVPPMRVLAIDTALEACAAAVLDTEHGKVASESIPMVRGHAEALMPLIARVMAQADMPFAALDRIAVTTGPGSFTGLRVGISAARGIALAAAKPAVGLTTLAAYAAPHIAHDDKTAVAVAIDARHQHVYLQIFGSGGRTLVAPRIASVAEAVRAAAIGPVRIVGTGASMLAAAWPSREPAPALVDDRRAPDIIWVGRLAAAADESAGDPKPLYLRAPDAQPQDAARLPRR